MSEPPSIHCLNFLCCLYPLPFCQFQSMADEACPAKYNSADSEQDNFAGYAGVTLKELGIKVADEADSVTSLDSDSVAVA